MGAPGRAVPFCGGERAGLRVDAGLRGVVRGGEADGAPAVLFFFLKKGVPRKREFFLFFGVRSVASLVVALLYLSPLLAHPSSLSRYLLQQHRVWRHGYDAHEVIAVVVHGSSVRRGIRTAARSTLLLLLIAVAGPPPSRVLLAPP